MKRVFTRKRNLFLSAAIVLGGLNQLTAAQIPVSVQAKAGFESASEQPVAAQEKAINSLRERTERPTSTNSNNYIDTYNLSRTYAKAGDYEHAIEYLKKVIELNPGSAVTYNELGVLYCHLNQFDKAINAFSLAMGYEERNAVLTANLGAANYLIGNNERAIELLKQALKQDPTLEVAQNNLGEILLKIGRYKDALECLSRVHPEPGGKNAAQLYNDIGVAHLYLKHFKEAVHSLRRAIEINDTFGLARFNLGVVSLAIKDRAAAYEQYVALKSVDPGLAEKLYAKIYQPRMLVVKPDSQASRGFENR